MVKDHPHPSSPTLLSTLFPQPHPTSLSSLWVSHTQGSTASGPCGTQVAGLPRSRVKEFVSEFFPLAEDSSKRCLTEMWPNTPGECSSSAAFPWCVLPFNSSIPFKKTYIPREWKSPRKETEAAEQEPAMGLNMPTLPNFCLPHPLPQSPR